MLTEVLFTFAWWLRKPMLWLVRGVRVAPDDVKARLNLDPHRPVCYVLPERSWSDLFVLDRLCRELGLPRVLVPARPGITNALGCVVADLRHDFVRTLNRPLDTVDIAQVLKEEGFISDFKVEPGTPSAQLVLSLKYGETGDFVIRSIERVSKPGCRVYRPAGDLRPIVRGLGIQILSTPKGIVSDRVARRDRIGGEVLCKVY